MSTDSPVVNFCLVVAAQEASLREEHIDGGGVIISANDVSASAGGLLNSFTHHLQEARIRQSALRGLKCMQRTAPLKEWPEFYMLESPGWLEYRVETSKSRARFQAFGVDVILMSGLAYFWHMVGLDAILAGYMC